MKSIQNYIDAAIKLWQDNTPAARVAIVLLAVLSVVAIGGVGYWSVQPTFVVLATDLDSSKVDAIIDQLDKEGIEYELSGAGGNLSVDKRYFAKARLIVRNQGAQEIATTDDIFAGAFASPTERRNRARLVQQQSLARTIQKLTAVDHADVHLNVPDKGPFEREVGQASASVLLTLRPGTQLTQEQAASIASLVAYAVENLAPESVQITDKEGRSYTMPDEQTHQINSQVEYVAHAEGRLARKAEAQLLQFLGHGNASVQVSLDLTFTNGSRKITKYDADGAVPSQEDLISETTKNGDGAAEGVAGVAGNLQTRGARGKSVESKTENIKTSYLVPKTEETQVNTTPIRNSLSVSVLINSSASGIQQEDGTLAPGLSEQVSAIVKNAVGFKDGADTISVEFLPFPENELTADAVPAPFEWGQVTSIVESSSLAIAAVFAFVIGLLLLRKFRPVGETPSRGSESLGQDRQQSIDQLSELIRNNPDVFREIVKSWAGVDQPKSKERKAA